MAPISDAWVWRLRNEGRVIPSFAAIPLAGIFLLSAVADAAMTDGNLAQAMFQREELRSGHPGGVCAFETPQEILFERGGPHDPGSELHTMRLVEDLPTLWAAAPPQTLARFRTQLHGRRIQTESAVLLRQANTPNNALVLANLAAWVGPIRCMEALLFAAQDERIPILDASTEFVAFILRSPDGRTLKIYNYTRNLDGIGNVARMLGPIEMDVASGWTLEAALHNHNFHPNDSTLNGALAPSEPDASLMRNLAERFGLREAWITNGVDTARIPASAFSGLSGEGKIRQRQ